MKVHTPIRRFALVLCLASLPLAAPALTPEEVVSAADQAEKAGSLDKAVELYSQFLKDNPDHVQRSVVQYRLALALDGLGRTDKALAALKEVVATPPSAAPGSEKHRPDAFMRLAKLQADAGDYAEAAATLEKLFKEGAGLYEDEAQNLRAGYLTLLGKYDDAAVLFNILRNKRSSPFAKEAACKLAIVYLKANNDELAKDAIEAFAKEYPGHPRVVELLLRLARSYYDKKNYKSASDLCRQVMSDYKDAPEAMEAAFIVAISYRDSGNFETAVQRLEEVSRMPQAAHNTVLACECLFEAAQISRKSLNKLDKAAELYHMAAIKARDGLTERQQQIQEQSLYYEAEYLFKLEKWSAAYDLYAQLRKIGSKLNILGRIMYCQSKMNPDGAASLTTQTAEELNYIRQRIADNPGTIVALQSEVFLLEQKVDQARRQSSRYLSWNTVQPLLDEYSALLTKYPTNILRQQDMGSYIRTRMGVLYTYLSEDTPLRIKKLNAGIALLEQALTDTPEALFRVEAFEALASLSAATGEKKKAYDVYQKLFALTGQDQATKSRRVAAEYLQNMVAMSETAEIADEALKTMQELIKNSPPESEEAREARFYVAELLYVTQKYSDAAKAYKEYVKLYGPAQDTNGNVIATNKPPNVDALLDRVYESGLRVAHCWRTQGHTANMIAAYRWVVANQNYRNPRIAEAAYMAIVGNTDLAKLPPAKKEETGQALWTAVINASLDFGSKAFQSGFHPWLRDTTAMPYVRAAMLKSAQLTAEAGNHRRAAEMYRQYVEIFDPTNPKAPRDSNNKPIYTADEFYDMALYAAGREFVLANDAESMVKLYRSYVDDRRDSKFRTTALQLMGHYGTQAGLYDDAADAYAVLIDEYSAPDVTNGSDRITFVAPEFRLKKNTSWDGIRLTPPDKWDAGDVRFGLGFLYWKKEQWSNCQAALEPFLTAPALRKSASRAEALFMLGRSKIKTGLVTAAQKVFEQLIADHPDFKGLEDVYLEVIRMNADLANWQAVDRYITEYAAKFPAGLRRNYVEIYEAMSKIGKGKVEDGERDLLALAKSETYEDVKGEAYYRLAMRRLPAKSRDPAAALPYLRKSVEAYPTAPVLLEASQCAAEIKDWAAAREFLDRLLREFPKADRMLIDAAQTLRKKVSDMESGARR